MNALWVTTTFLFGFAAKQLQLPPMVGYLVAGFIINYLGIQPLAALETIAELGITMLLFTIGLKLDVKRLAKPLILYTSVLHIIFSCLIFAGLLLLLGYLSSNKVFALSWQQAALIGFAFSFSSTICAIKILQDRGELAARHGSIAVGILVIQDIASVLFLIIAYNKMPSVWALLLIFIPLLRKPLILILENSGHDELLCLVGFFIAIFGGWVFHVVGIDENFGALVFGALLARHPKASELNKALMNFKELFLIAFFISVGFSAQVNLTMLLIALAITLLLVMKGALLVFLLMLFKSRARIAVLSAMALFNYSEFGLIVLEVCVEHAWLSSEWLVVVALAVAISFVISTIINSHAHNYFKILKSFLARYETKDILPEDRHFNIGKVDVLIIGMGSIGTVAYESLAKIYQGKICGIDSDQFKVAVEQDKGRNVIVGDGTNFEFWGNQKFIDYKLVMLALSSLQDNLEVTKQLLERGYRGKIAAISLFRDEEYLLKEAGVNMVFNYHIEAGMGYASHALAEMYK